MRQVCTSHGNTISLTFSGSHKKSKGFEAEISTEIHMLHPDDVKRFLTAKNTQKSKMESHLTHADTETRAYTILSKPSHCVIK